MDVVERLNVDGLFLAKVQKKSLTCKFVGIGGVELDIIS